MLIWKSSPYMWHLNLEIWVSVLLRQHIFSKVHLSHWSQLKTLDKTHTKKTQKKQPNDWKINKAKGLWRKLKLEEATAQGWVTSFLFFLDFLNSFAPRTNPVLELHRQLKLSKKLHLSNQRNQEKNSLQARKEERRLTI